VITIDVDGLTFEFPDDWLVTRYDEWAFYRNQFAACGRGNKGVDLLALEPRTMTLWLLEVKDYRRHRREKDIPLWDEVALKARDTLAGLVAAGINGVDDERTTARRVLQAQKMRVVCHLEQPEKPSKLFPRPFNPADVRQKLRQLLKPIDAHVLVVDAQNLRTLPWAAH
jgi:hypothetical protein